MVFKAVTQFARKNIAYLAVGVAAIGLGVGGTMVYATAVDYTNSLGFCANSCHEMHDTVYAEYTHSKHFRNEQGVVVACAQCHVPQNNWPGTFGHKALATFELWNHFVLGESDPAKFTPRRLILAKKVWAGFAATNARECKACHKYSNMVLEDQRPSIRAQHQDAMKTDENCLDCHKGITHKKFEDAEAKPAKPAGASDFDVQ
jgi:nitrate/TMAO reductase-like tetraheme cytochrome c subunit